jgi:hypothetical protein
MGLWQRPVGQPVTLLVTLVPPLPARHALQQQQQVVV